MAFKKKRKRTFSIFYPSPFYRLPLSKSRTSCKFILLKTDLESHCNYEILRLCTTRKPRIDDENSNFYGAIRKDCDATFQKNDTIVLFTSNKDITNRVKIALLDAKTSIKIRREKWSIGIYLIKKEIY